MKKLDKIKLYKILSILILIGMFIFMVMNGNNQSFWVDELDWTLSYMARNNIIDMFQALLTQGYNLPLYYIIMFFV